VVRTAADLADEAGWEALTLAEVATRLGVRQPSLYKHIASLADLRRGVSLLAVTELGDLLIAAVAGRSGADALQHLAFAYRDYAHQHPGRYSASVIAPTAGDDEHARRADAVLRALAAVLRGYGLADDSPGEPTPGGDEASTGAAPAGTPGTDALHAIRALRALLHGFVALEASGGFGLPLDLDESYRRMVAGFDAALRRQPDEPGSRAPVTAR